LLTHPVALVLFSAADGTGSIFSGMKTQACRIVFVDLTPICFLEQALAMAMERALKVFANGRTRSRREPGE
jgi:hypothetical protein